MAQIQSLCGMLPVEIWQQIFSYVYAPFYLRYTQTHDQLPDSRWQRFFEETSLSGLQGKPLLDNLPSIAPILTSKYFAALANPIFQASWMGCVHIVGKLIWKEVHLSYAGLMARAKDLVISEEDVWPFLSLKYIEKMPLLQSVTFIMGFRSHRFFQYEMVGHEVCIKAFGRRTTDGDEWSDVDEMDLFMALRGRSSEPYKLKHFWTFRGIRPLWRWVFFAVVDPCEINRCRDLMVVEFTEDNESGAKLTRASLRRAEDDLMS